jgi:hypothetical protein
MARDRARLVSGAINAEPYGCSAVFTLCFDQPGRGWLVNHGVDVRGAIVLEEPELPI